MSKICVLKDLLKGFEKYELYGSDNAIISGIEYDSRKIKRGSLFVAVTGFKIDGNQYIAQAIEKGAAAILTEKYYEHKLPVIVVPEIRTAMSDIAAAFYDNPADKMQNIAVTGTNGKSSSVYLIKMILKAAGYKAGMLNSLVYDTGNKKYKAERTTPDSVDIQKYLSEMVQAGCTYGIIEVSSHALVLQRVRNIKFKIGLFTNFTRDHLDFHKTMDEYLNAKKLLLKKLSGNDKAAVVNSDVSEFESFTREALCPIIRFSAGNSEADLTVSDVVLGSDQTTFTLNSIYDSSPVKIKLLGRYNLSNTVGAAAVGLALGFDLATIARGLGSAEAVSGRFEPVRCGQPFTVLIDYAHTSDAIFRLCQSAKEITKGKILTLFGCGGDRDSGKRPLMGIAASENSDFCVITSDNPRTEDPDLIIKDILPGMANNNYEIISDRGEAIARIISMAQEGDTVLIAGKGAEDYQEIGTERFPFTDKGEIIASLKKRGYEEVRSDKVELQ
ncbi:MAG: UDP-N-acetylmuramoyl-L-alanyl-D-glutamate--2,6-diaminopimelate ligase [Candidatus Zixiibacteriota bacterium]